MAQIEKILTGKEKDLGGFSVRRILPYATHRMVGPFIFFDHMGPAQFTPGQGLDVRPHPHIGLATVTYLFEGIIRHQDSLGSDQNIEPGAINWMTAGRGIVHSERTPLPLRRQAQRMNGIQCWVALPEEHEDCEPSFIHHPSQSLPQFQVNRCQLKLLLGSLFNKISPVQVQSELFYLEIKMPQGCELELPTAGLESAVYAVQGAVTVSGQSIKAYEMAIVEKNSNSILFANEDCHLMVLGGKPVGERFIFWNFVSSSKDKIEKAKKDWQVGPRPESFYFNPIPGDQSEFIPLPTDVLNPKGTIL